MMIKVLKLGVLLLASIAISGCFIGDPALYGIEGEIYSSATDVNLDNKIKPIEKISSVKVTISCVDSGLSYPHETLSNDNGFFILEGQGGGGDCVVTFEHPEFVRKVIKLNPELREEPKGGLSWFWKINIKLEPKE